MLENPDQKTTGKDVIEIDGFLRKHGIDTVFLREGVDTSTPTGALYRNIMSSVAEFEGTFIRAQHDAIVSDVLFGKCGKCDALKKRKKAFLKMQGLKHLLYRN